MKINNITFNSASLPDVWGKDHNLVKIGDEKRHPLKINNDFTYEKPSTLIDVWGKNYILVNKLLEILDGIQEIASTSFKATTNFICTKTSNLINYLSTSIFGKSEEEQFFDANEFVDTK